MGFFIYKRGNKMQEYFINIMSAVIGGLLVLIIQWSVKKNKST